MKIKNYLILFLLLLTTFSLSSCDFILTFNQQTESTVISTLPTPVNGTITFNNSDYSELPVYSSPTYSLTDIDEYNTLILETQDFIRRANIEIKTTLYNSGIPFVIGGSSVSGFVFMEDDTYFYAITNYHVVDTDGYDVTYEIMTYSDDDFSYANLVAYDEDLDLAVIKFDKLGRTDVNSINIYKRLYYKFNVGELVLAIGNPLSVINNVTFGEFIGMESIDNVDYDVMFHNAAIHEGSSGGALVDVDGNLLGVNTWGLDMDDPYSFSIPNYVVYTFLINKGIID